MKPIRRGLFQYKQQNNVPYDLENYAKICIYCDPISWWYLFLDQQFLNLLHKELEQYEIFLSQSKVFEYVSKYHILNFWKWR